jgi:hypothetical protein
MGYALRTWDVAEVRGLVVEPVKHLLIRLPNLPGVVKVDVALGSTDGSVVFNYVREDAAIRFPDSYAVYLAHIVENDRSISRTKSHVHLNNTRKIRQAYQQVLHRFHN